MTATKIEEWIVPLIQMKLIKKLSAPAYEREAHGEPLRAKPPEREKCACEIIWITMEEICSGEWEIGGPARHQ